MWISLLEFAPTKGVDQRAEDRNAPRFCSQSPTWLSDKTVKDSASDGQSTGKMVCLMSLRPSLIMLPQVGSGGCTLKPRKLSVPSTTMTNAAATKA